MDHITDELNQAGWEAQKVEEDFMMVDPNGIQLLMVVGR